MKPRANPKTTLLTVTRNTIAQCLAALPMSTTKRISVCKMNGAWILTAELS